jgi:hypothetical protein
MSQSPKASVSDVKGVPQETIKNIKASLHKTPKHVEAILTEEQLKTQKSLNKFYDALEPSKF